MAVMLKHVAELRFDDAGQRERREFPFRKEIDTAGFNTFAGAAATEFANEEKFENVMLNRRMVVFIAIVDCGEFFHDDIEAGFSSTEAQAEQWVTNFLGHTTANLVQDGSADNCPFSFQTGGPVSCGPVDDDNDPSVRKTWTQAQYIRLERGLAPGRILPLPQIYIPLQAWQWANIVTASNGQLTLPAVLTEHAADGTEFAAAQGWSSLWDALSTRANASAPTMSVDLRSDGPTVAAARAHVNPQATLPQG